MCPLGTNRVPKRNVICFTASGSLDTSAKKEKKRNLLLTTISRWSHSKTLVAKWQCLSQHISDMKRFFSGLFGPRHSQSGPHRKDRIIIPQRFHPRCPLPEERGEVSGKSLHLVVLPTHLLYQFSSFLSHSSLYLDILC
jgi:hypothetical protein